MKTGDTVYVRYIDHIRHWPKGPLTVSIDSVEAKFITLTINGDVCHFTRTDLQHENQVHRPAYRLYRTTADYTLETELAALKNLMALTNFAHLPLKKQRAIKAILEA